MAETKYIFVTGGVVSSLGKGIIASSIGRLLQARGYKVTIQKFDPYINVDSGTLNPYEHGECYVTVDGHEGDLDLGHYERFLHIETTKNNNITAGRIYQNVILKERRGDFLGKTVQVIPHITDEIKRSIKIMSNKNRVDFVICEIGGTVGDIESTPFLEAVRQMRWELGKNCYCIHLTYVPFLVAAREVKTKPTQHSVKELQSVGIQPDMLVLRTEQKLNKDILDKVALFCNVEQDAVMQSVDLESIYEVPIMMRKQGMDEVILRKLGMSLGEHDGMEEWRAFIERWKNAEKEVRIKLVGKYAELRDAYKSIRESLFQAATYNDRKLVVEVYQSEKINKDNVAEMLGDADGVVIAPGFGRRGVDGKIVAINYCRENDLPTFGIGLGMECMVIEYARSVLGITDADSSEFESQSENKVIELLSGNIRLGAYECKLKESSLAFKAYQKPVVSERHRNRFEFNNKYREQFEQGGIVFSGINPEFNLVEIIEIPTLHWFLGTIYHPEYNSTVVSPNPLFLSFIKAAADFKEQKL